jgi:hypothetical protein
MVALGREAYLAGFDELNFDYVRFPSDGDMNDISYPFSEGETKTEVIKKFFSYLYRNLKDPSLYLADHVQNVLIGGVDGEDDNVPALSVDLFGMTTTNMDDLNIGQVLEYALPYFDYVSPMVYPSHYPPGFNGYARPALLPYEVVKFSMDSAVERIIGFQGAASTTPAVLEGRISPRQLRPWLQDFDLGAVYTAEMVRAQIQAVYDAGLTSWMLWDPTNQYTLEALLPVSAGTSTDPI